MNKKILIYISIGVLICLGSGDNGINEEGVEQEPDLTKTLSVDISPDIKERIEVGDNITINAFADGALTSAEIILTKPDGGRDYIQDSEYSFSSTYYGQYRVSISKEGYMAASKSFNVSRKSTEMNINVVEKTITIQITSHGKEVEGVNMSAVLTKPLKGTEPKIYNEITDIQGEAIIIVDKNGNYTIVAEKHDYEGGKKTVLISSYNWDLLVICGSIILILAIGYFIIERKSKAVK